MADTKGVEKGAGIAVFAQVLFALVMKTAYDSVARKINNAADVSDLAHRFSRDLPHSLILSLQLFIFLFTLVRFYWGTYRYHEETSEDRAGAHFVLGLVGAVFVFSGFYFAAIYITNITLFYFGFLLMHVFDLSWFSAYFVWCRPSDAMRVVTLRWTVLDLLGVIGILLFFIALLLWGPRLWMQATALLTLLSLGLFDFYMLWGFYSNKPDWKTSVTSSSIVNSA